MLEPSYAELSKLGISEVVYNKDDISKVLFRFVSRKERQIKIKRGLNFLARNRKVIEQFLIRIKWTNKKGTKIVSP